MYLNSVDQPIDLSEIDQSGYATICPLFLRVDRQ